MKDAIEELKKLKARRVFVQFPEGLTLKIQEISRELEKNGFEVVVCIEKCFGACDVKVNEAKAVGCDAILHIGHEKFFDAKFPVVYWEYFIEADPVPVLEKEIEKLKDFTSIGLITSIQFVKTIPVVKDFLEKKGKKVFVNKSLQHPGQILGCNLEAAKAVEKDVDCFLCISAGKFYGLGLSLISEKPMLNLDLEKKEICSLENFRKKIQKITAWNKAQLKDARRVGILVSWKLGQLKQPFELKRKLEKEGKDVFIFIMDEITPEKLIGLKIDFLVAMACPRIAIDDLERYKIPIVNWDEIDL